MFSDYFLIDLVLLLAFLVMVTGIVGPIVLVIRTIILANKHYMESIGKFSDQCR